MQRNLSSFFPNGPDASRVAAGCMTGSSVDALDVAWVRAEGRGHEMRAEILDYGQVDLGELREPLARLSHQEPFTANEIARLAHELGELHARALRPGGAVVAPPLAELVAIHGQTVAHDGQASWALFDPAPLSAWLQVPIVTDLRTVDRGADGEGAPITPLADWILLRSSEPRQVVNLGGFCNITSLPAQNESPAAVTGRDVTPCNQLLDAAARRWFDLQYDADGERALAGQVDEDRIAVLRDGLVSVGGRGRSLGTGDEGFHLLDALDGLRGEDALATLVAAVADTIVKALPPPSEVLLFGGGAKNRALVSAFESRLEGRRVLIGGGADSRLDPTAREAAAMAVLGLLAADGVPITVPGVTGRGETFHLDGRWLLPR